MSSYCYLAAPYSSPDPIIREQRVEAANILAAYLMEHLGAVVYSPITHSAGVVAHLLQETVEDHRFWMRQCLPLLQHARRVIVLTAPGWKESKGVQMELEAARAMGIPVYRTVARYHNYDPEHYLEGATLRAMLATKSIGIKRT